jgi:hypothetical protein
MKSWNVYRIKLMFEWGGGTIWCANEPALSKFAVGPIEQLLPVSDSVRNRLFELTTWHDTALNWAYPPDPSPWSDEERTRFEAAANSILIELQTELGSSFEVIYQPL